MRPAPARLRRREFLISILAAAAVRPAAAEEFIPYECPPGSIAFRRVNLVPMDSDRILEDHTVIVRLGSIEAVGPSAELEIPEDAQVIDAPGLWLMPGLADMHTHFYPANRYWENDVFLFLANGVTTVREMWGQPSYLRWRAAVDTGAVEGPRMFLCSPGLDGPLGPWGSPVTTADQATRLVEQHKRAGFDYIKVYSWLEPHVFNAIAAACRAESIRFVGHTSRFVGWQAALDAGQYTIEHFMGFEAAATPRSLISGNLDLSTVHAMAEAQTQAGCWTVPTFGIHQLWRDTDAEFQARPEMRYISPVMKAWFRSVAQPTTDPARLIANYKAILKTMHDAGAKVMMGCDSGFRWLPQGFAIHDELRITAEAGLTPYQAYRLATVAAAENTGKASEFGTVEPGRRADLVLLRANPLEDVANFRQRAGVMAAGRWMSESYIQNKLEDIARQYEN